MSDDNCIFRLFEFSKNYTRIECIFKYCVINFNHNKKDNYIYIGRSNNFPYTSQIVIFCSL